MTLGSVPLSAQTASTIRLPGKTIEVVGLERWTVQMIQDSLNRYSPGDSLQSHACAAILRYKLHFADAAAQYLPGSPPDTGMYVFVSVVEPQDSARVHYRTVDLRPDTATITAEWRTGTDLVRHHPMGFQIGLQIYLTPTAERRVPAWAEEDSSGVRLMWSYLDAHQRPSDAAAARRTLRDDANMLDRMAAAAVLINFAADDSTWWALSDVLLESEGYVKATAAQVLATLAGYRPRPVDWLPAAPTVHALLDGTDLFALPTMMTVLTRTGANPRLARALLGGGGHAVLAYAGAVLRSARVNALGLLAALRGADLGGDIGDWRAWIHSL
jgi:hypothetical protein